MGTITAFVAKSFAQVDEPKVQIVENLLSAYKPQGFFWKTAEAAEIESVSLKVRKLISECDVFVGIFTRRHPVHKSISRMIDRYHAAIGEPGIQGWTCPPWLLQESGFALALSKRLILFRESSVEIPGLQGDLEYINFDPSNPAPAIQHANEMINRLIADLRGITVTTTTVEAVQAPPEMPTPSVVPTLSENDVSSNPTEEEMVSHEGDSKGELFDAIIAKDWTNAEQLLQKMEQGDERTGLFWRAWYLMSRIKDGDSEAFEKLKQLYKRHPDHEGVAIFTAQSLSKFEQYDEAIALLATSASISKDADDKRSLVLARARTLIAAKRPKEAKQILLSLFSESEANQTIDGLTLLADALRADQDAYSAAAVAELTLKRQPSQSNVRYRVGLDYHSLKQWSLFLWQYKMYCQNNREDSGGFHNLALAYSNCDLPIKSVRGYLRAYELGSVLSASNLAYKYLDAGMADEAEKLLTDALSKHTDSASVVGHASSAITERKEKESKDEDKLLTEASKWREFMIIFGEGFLDPSPLSVTGKWAFDFGSMELHQKDDTLSGTAEISDSKNNLTLALMGRSIGSSVGSVIRYDFNAVMTGRAGKFIIEEQPITSVFSQTILGSTYAKKTEGYVVFHSNMQSAQMMQIEGDTWKTPKVISRAEAAQ